MNRCTDQGDRSSQGPGTSTLVVAAHPDDEVLACGGTIARLTALGATVRVLFLADGVHSRVQAPSADTNSLAERRDAARHACYILGAEPPEFRDYPDNQLDTVALLELTQQVEASVECHSPDTVLTHHSADLNVDHRRVHEAVTTACRPQPGHPVQRLLFFEVASSTEWQSPDYGRPFAPNLFVDISTTLHRKLDALRAYHVELRRWPHSRSARLRAWKQLKHSSWAARYGEARCVPR